MKTFIASIKQSLVLLNSSVKMWILYAIMFALGRFQFGCAHALLENVVFDDRLAHTEGSLWTENIRKGEYLTHKLYLALDKGFEIKTVANLRTFIAFKDRSKIITIPKNLIKIEVPSINICAHALLESVLIDDRFTRTGESLWIEFIRNGEYPTPKLYSALDQGYEIRTTPDMSAFIAFNDSPETITMPENHIRIENPNMHIRTHVRLESVLINDRLAHKGESLGIEVIRAGEYVMPELKMDLQEGDEIRTSTGITTFIQFDEDSEIILAPETHIQIETPERGIFGWFGRIIASVKGKFKVKTEYFEAGVERTKFIIHISKDGESIVMMVEGSIILTSNENRWSPVSLQTGQQARIQGEKEPQKAPIPEDEYIRIIESIDALQRIRGKKPDEFVSDVSTQGGGGGWLTSPTDHGIRLPANINGGYVNSPYFPVQPVFIIPEPTTVLLLSLGGLGLLRKRGA